MTYKLVFDKEVLNTIRKWKRSNPIAFKKLYKVMDDIMAHPRTRLGHPKPLVGGGGKRYSRHITAHDRVVYEVDGSVFIIQVDSHYDDK